MKSLSFSFLLLYITTLVVDAEISYIIRGSTVRKNDRIKFIVSIQRNGRHRCGGSILSERFVLTAAHCTFPNEPEAYDVVVGSNDNSKGSKFKIQEFIVHPYNDNKIYKDDLCIIKLAKSLQFSDSVGKISISKSDILGGENVAVYGWGQTSRRKPYYTQYNLKTLEMKAVDIRTCIETYNRRKVYHPPSFDSLCLTHERWDAGPCGGDSGGPVVYENELVGVTSWGHHDCGTIIEPSVAVRLHPFYDDWIEEIITEKKSTVFCLFKMQECWKQRI